MKKKLFRKQMDIRKMREVFIVLKRLLELGKGRKELCKSLLKIKNKQKIRKVFTFLNKRKVIMIIYIISYIIFRK